VSASVKHFLENKHKRSEAMTIQEFLDYIRTNSKAGDWQTCRGRNKNIRRNGTSDHTSDNECPICWVGSSLGKNSEGIRTNGFGVIAARIGLTEKDSDQIACAADSLECHYFGIKVNTILRQELLAACHLT
jgi:hypothetical protein